MPEPPRCEASVMVDYKPRLTIRLLPPPTRNSNSCLRYGANIRAVSARALEGTILRIFVVAVAEMNLNHRASVTSLDLVTEETTEDEFDWQPVTTVARPVPVSLACACCTSPCSSFPRTNITTSAN